jgi:hypothetical protein
MAKRTKKAARNHPTSERRQVVSETVGKRVVFDRETWQALDLLARDSMNSFQELADEAFRDLLHKHGRPDTLRDALRDSLEGKRARAAIEKPVPRRRPR